MIKSFKALLMVCLFVIPNLSAEVGTLTFRANVSGAAVWNNSGELAICQSIPFNVNIYSNHAGGSTARQA